ncbi:uncharacterized protein isoform X2 [Leptinotarsa decemlineata]|uniref:uncharacterized protein isoform X2 n=1 Tax=Leptinotarsa decemlineata TaxID=7539 RepID=UPI000C25232F|nr:uncharacterized protein LOC111509810 isoform X2 [Leptinotarsa decemlineata]
MSFFHEFLFNFSTSEVLHMFDSGAFCIPVEIRAVDDAIRTIIKRNPEEFWTAEDSEIYEKMQIECTAIVRSRCIPPPFESLGMTIKNIPTDASRFEYLIVTAERYIEDEIYGIVERSFTLAFKPIKNCETWSKNVMEELLAYVLRNFKDEDRVGFVFENQKPLPHKAKAKFPIIEKRKLNTVVIFACLICTFYLGSLSNESETMILTVLRLPKPFQKNSFEDDNKLYFDDLVRYIVGNEYK